MLSVLGDTLNALRPVLWPCTLGVLALALGCAEGTLGLDATTAPPDAAAAIADAGVVPRDAGAAPDAALPDSMVFPDAQPDPDASAADAMVTPDAGDCFEAPVRVWTSAAGPTGRAHGRVRGAVGYEDGWIVAVNGLNDPDQLISTDRRGAIRWVSSVDLYGEAARLFAINSSIYAFHGQHAQRLDVDASGISRQYNTVYVGGLTERGERTLTVTPLVGEEGFRALSLHFDMVAARWIVRVSELRPSATDSSGISHITGRLDLPIDLPVESAQYYLAGDHAWILVHGADWRVLDVQLGLGGLGTAADVPARVWSDEVWRDGPAQVIDLSGDRSLALTARVDSTSSTQLAQLERPPPATPAITTLGAAGLDLGFGSLSVATLDVGGRMVIATDRGISVFRFDGTQLLSSRYDGTPNIPLDLAQRQGDVAAVYVEADSSERHISIKCAALP